MKYRIQLMKPARKFIEKQPKHQQERILKAISRLPYEGDIKLLNGKESFYRLRVGDFRGIYNIDDAAMLVVIQNVGNRGDVYK